MGKTLKGMIPAVVNDLTTGGEASALSAEMGKVLNERTCPTATVSIPFDGGGRYIARADGAVTNNSGWVSTQYIEVNEGDEFIYTGNPGTVSKAVAGYELVEGQYVYKKTFVDYGNSLKQDVLIIIPSGITHIIAVDSKSGSTSQRHRLSEVGGPACADVLEGNRLKVSAEARNLCAALYKFPAIQERILQ